MDARSEQAIVGVFVVAAVGLLVVTVFLLSGRANANDVPYHTYFKNAGGLGPGAIVRYAGGPPIGRVRAVHSDPKDATRMEIDFAISPNVPVKVDSKTIITNTSPLADNFLGILPGSNAAAKAPRNAELPSVEYVAFSDVLAVVSELGPHANELVSNLNDRTVELKDTLVRLNDLLNPQNRANISASLGNVRGMLDEDRPEIRNAIKNVDETTEKLSPLIDDFRKAASQANDSLAHLDAVIGEDRPDLHQAVASLRQALGSAASLSDHLDQTVNTNQESLDEILDNLRHVTENLNSFTETIKTRPYTLIRPVGIKPRKPGDSPRP